jgi:hypothetical protein
MKLNDTVILDVTNITGSGEGSLVNTGNEKRNVADGKCRFSLSVTGFAGTSMAVDIVATINGIDQVLGSFASVTGTVVETITLDTVPAIVKVEYTATAVTDFDATVTATRLW